MTARALHIDIRQELHLDLFDAVPLTFLASATLDVEAESAGAEAPEFCFRKRGEKVADRAEHFGVSCCIGTGCTPDGALVDHNGFINMFQPEHRFVFARFFRIRHLELLLQHPLQNPVHQRRFPAARDPGDAGECAERDGDIDIFQVVMFRPDDLQVLAAAAFAFCGDRDLLLAGKIFCRHGPGEPDQIRRFSFRHDLAAVNARRRTQVDHVVCRQDRIDIMLHYHHGVADVPEPFEGGKEFVIVPLMQPDTGFVQDVEDTHQPASQLGGKADPLCLSAGKGAGFPVQRQVAQPHVQQEPEPVADLFEDLARDGGFFFVQLQI